MSPIWVVSPFEFESPLKWEQVWEHDLRHDVISIGWTKMGDVSKLSVDELTARHEKVYNSGFRSANADAHSIHKFFHDIRHGHTVVARRGRKSIAAVGIVNKGGEAFHDPKFLAGDRPSEYRYPNHLRVKWQRQPRDIFFDRQVFGIQTVHTILPTGYSQLTQSKGVRVKHIFPDEVIDNQDFIEGGGKQVTVNKYERDRKARLACISIHGLNCTVCEMSFAEVYGEIGEGYIHVHHLKPVSSRRRKHRIDPAKDLLPVCPNCHAMLHTSDPPLKVDQLRKILCQQGQRR